MLRSLFKKDKTTITYVDDVTVSVHRVAGSDEDIASAARISTMGDAATPPKELEGLIGYLMRSRHGSPFEHTHLSFTIRAPIFVWREFMRHRIGFSYNEQSGRYMVMEPVFYIPGNIRRQELVQVGKASHYELVPGTDRQFKKTVRQQKKSIERSWRSYENQLNAGIAKEVARMALPLSLMSSVRVTTNPRALMSFLSLRVRDDNAMFPSKPQREINMVADKLELILAETHPVTHAMYIQHGRVAP